MGVDRDDDFNKTVKDFVNKNVGKEYRLNASKLLG